MLKRVIILLIVLITIFGCAKKSTEFKDEHILNLSAAIPMVGNPLDIDTADNLVYVAEDQGGFSIVNLDDLSKKTYTALYSNGTNLVNLKQIRYISVLKDFNRLFIKESGSGTISISVVDISEPDTMRFLVPITGGTADILDMKFQSLPDTTGAFKYEGLFTKDFDGIRGISYGKYGKFDPNFPPYFSETQSYKLPVDADGFYLASQYLYVAAEQRGLIIFSRNGTTPPIIGQVDLPGVAVKVKVMGNYAFVVCKQDGLQIVDITDPTHPVKVGSFDTTGYATSLDTWTDHVVVSSGGGGVYVFNVANPSNPVLEENITDCGYVNKVKYYQNRVLVASRDMGLLIYNIEP